MSPTSSSPPRARGVDGRLHRLRPGFRLPRERGLDVRRAAARQPAHARPGGRRRPGRRLRGRVSARDAGRLAADRHDPRPSVRSDAASPARAPRPGTRVRFVAPRRAASPPAAVPHVWRARPESPAAATRWSPRPARDAPGRGPAGRSIASGSLPRAPLDRGSLRTANRLVGNREDAAAIEITMGGFRAVADARPLDRRHRRLGAGGLGGREVDPYAAHALARGRTSCTSTGSRTARAPTSRVRGGIGGPRRPRLAVDRRARRASAPRRCRRRRLRRRRRPTRPIPPAVGAPWGAPHDDELELELAPGPRADWFAASALILFEATWTVSQRGRSRRGASRRAAPGAHPTASCPARAWCRVPCRFPRAAPDRPLGRRSRHRRLPGDRGGRRMPRSTPRAGAARHAPPLPSRALPPRPRVCARLYRSI